MKTILLAATLAVVAGTAHATVVPVAGSSYTEIDWAPLNPNGNSLSTPLGTISTSAAGGTSFAGASPQLSGQGVVFGQDTLNVFLGFTVHQILFNFTSGPVPSKLTADGIVGGFALPVGTAGSLDLYSATGITQFSFAAIAYAIDNTFDLGTLYVSNSSTPLNGQGFSQPTLAPVPEPASAGVLALGLLALGRVRRTARRPAA